MKGVVILSIFLLVGTVIGYTEHEYKYAFAGWMHDHSRMYTSEEFLGRFEIFKSNMDYVNEWNARNTETVLGLNNLADLSNAEYQAIYLGTHIDGTERLANPSPFDMPTTPLADTIDWRTQGVVTDIKDQGQCGSCWAFSATGSIEAAHELATKELVSLSEQNLMDCSTAQGNQGCNGGLMDNAFKYVISAKGIDTEISYPYQTRQGACRFSLANVGATISSFKDVKAGNETALLAAVNIQPVSVAIDASHNSFQLYKSGIYIESACSSSRLDHGVLAVGYGTDDSLKSDYWIVKNSWGKAWGMNGYINMLRNRNNQCGIATAASYPVV